MMPRPSVPRPRGSRATGPLPGSESANARPNVRREGSGPRLTLAGKSIFPATMICPRKLQASPVPAAPALALAGCRGGLLGLLPEDKGQGEDEKQDALRAVHDDPDQCAAVAPRRVRQREDIDQGRWDHPRLVQVVDREQEAVGNPVPAPKRTLHPRQQHPAEQQLFSEGSVEHEQGDDDSEPDPVARHERLTRVGCEEDVEVVAGYGWDHTENRDGTLGGEEQHERNDDEPEPAADASGCGAAR